ncbi:MAG: hypothetical protein ACLPJH_00310 [Myxococcaceae bacterium]
MPRNRKPVVIKPGGKYTVSALALGDAGCQAALYDKKTVTFVPIQGWLTFTNEMTDGSDQWVLTPVVIWNHTLQTANVVPNYVGYCEKGLNALDVKNILDGGGPLGGLFTQAPAKA